MADYKLPYTGDEIVQKLTKTDEIDLLVKTSEFETYKTWVSETLNKKLDEEGNKITHEAKFFNLYTKGTSDGLDGYLSLIMGEGDAIQLGYIGSNPNYLVITETGIAINKNNKISGIATENYVDEKIGVIENGSY